MSVNGGMHHSVDFNAKTVLGGRKPRKRKVRKGVGREGGREVRREAGKTVGGRAGEGV